MWGDEDEPQERRDNAHNDEQDTEDEGAPVTAYMAHLTESAAFHALSGAVSPPARYGTVSFLGILIDTGASHFSTSGKAQFEAYCAFTGTRPSLSPSWVVSRFGIGDSKALGATAISFPFSDVVLEATFHIMDTDTPFLLGMQGVHCNNVKNRLIHDDSDRSIHIVRENGHPWIRWNLPLHYPGHEASFPYVEAV